MSPRAFGYERPGEGATNDWITPRWIIDALGGPDFFGTDPCASESQPWPTARVMNTQSMANGLSIPWWGHVWCNPPYGPRAKVWLEHMSLRGDGIALVFARTETESWQRIVFPTASAILFMDGRVRFCRPGDGKEMGSAGAPSALIAWGKECASKLIDSPIRGFRVEGKNIYRGGKNDAANS